jgi:hypothetical protein
MPERVHSFDEPTALPPDAAELRNAAIRDRQLGHRFTRRAPFRVFRHDYGGHFAVPHRRAGIFEIAGIAPLIRGGNPQLPADSQGSVLCDLVVSGNSSSAVVYRVLPNGVIAALANEPATVLSQVSQ